MQSSKWGRWFWKDRNALGRWHAIADAAGEYRLVCGRVRSRAPKATGGRPDDAQCCPTCRMFDDLRLGYKPETVETPTLVSAGA